MDIVYRKLVFGADPEFFFTKKGSVIGAEKVLPKIGMYAGSYSGQQQKIIIDGVQGEMNIIADTCRQIFAKNMRYCYQAIVEQAKKKGVDISFSQTVLVPKKEMKSLSPETQQFGCSPSENIHQKSDISIKDASAYPYRSAGGHVHLGLNDAVTNDILHNYKLIVPLLDVLVGNTMVLLDRDEGNIERRKVYGKAGEHRTPEYGVEYRTLSNFWIRSYPLVSLVLGMCRFAVNVAESPEATKAFMEKVSMEDITRAINTNDFRLAQSNFDKIKKLISETHANEDEGEYYYPLEAHRLAVFEKIVECGIDAVFPENPIEHWLNPHFIRTGWELFADNMVGVARPVYVTPKQIPSESNRLFSVAS